MESGTKLGHYEILSISDNGHGSSVAAKGLNEDGSPESYRAYLPIYGLQGECNYVEGFGIRDEKW